MKACNDDLEHHARDWLGVDGDLTRYPRCVESFTIEQVDTASPAQIEQLAHLLVACVDGGASVNFLRPLNLGVARQWWIDAFANELSTTWVAQAQGVIVACVRLERAAQPNAPHRGDVTKLLVDPNARGRGIARSLLTALELWALDHGCWRLVLDTETGSPAEPMYERLGWSRVGVIPEFALTPEGRMASTTIFTKSLL